MEEKQATGEIVGCAFGDCGGSVHFPWSKSMYWFDTSALSLFRTRGSNGYYLQGKFSFSDYSKCHQCFHGRGTADARSPLWPASYGVRGYKSCRIYRGGDFWSLSWNIVQGIYAFILGLFFVQLYEGYGKLWISILAHMVANATSVLLEEFAWLKDLNGNLIGYYLQAAGFTLVGVLVWKCILKKVQGRNT